MILRNLGTLIRPQSTLIQLNPWPEKLAVTEDVFGYRTKMLKRSTVHTYGTGRGGRSPGLCDVFDSASCSINTYISK